MDQPKSKVKFKFKFKFESRPRMYSYKNEKICDNGRFILRIKLHAKVNTKYMALIIE